MPETTQSGRLRKALGTFPRVRLARLPTPQHVTWNMPITAPVAAFQAVIAWGVGSS